MNNIDKEFKEKKIRKKKIKQKQKHKNNANYRNQRFHKTPNCLYILLVFIYIYNRKEEK